MLAIVQRFGIIILIAYIMLICPLGEVRASKYRILVVMSYEETFPWCISIKKGIESVLGEENKIRYFYMNTKENLDGGPGKARQANDLLLAFKPDGIIAADDNAQAMFVKPYLLNKISTPVIFCGVNGEAASYGYPGSNVTGVLERIPFKESLIFARQLVPTIKTFGLIIKESPTGDRIIEQLKRDSQSYPAKFTSYRFPMTIKEVASMTQELRKECDLLLVSALQGIIGKNGNPAHERDAVSLVVKTFGKATISTEEYNIKSGALCTVVRTGEEQGKKAAEMLLKALGGTPLSKIPITQNQYGKRIINVTAMKALGIKPEPSVLFGAKLVRTE